MPLPLILPIYFTTSALTDEKDIVDAILKEPGLEDCIIDDYKAEEDKIVQQFGEHSRKFVEQLQQEQAAHPTAGHQDNARQNG